MNIFDEFIEIINHIEREKVRYALVGCGNPTEEKAKPLFCKECGTENMPAATFCNQCGQRL